MSAGTVATHEVEPPSVRADWARFIALTFLFAFGFGVYSGVFQNYLRDVFHSNALGLGSLESIREVPGLLAALTAGSLVALAEAHIAGLGLAITAIGIAATGFVPGHNFLFLVSVTVLWSLGFHLWAVISTSITLVLAREREGGRHLGRMSGVSSMAGLAALLFAWLLSLALPHGLYRPYFVIAGVCIGAAAWLCTHLSANASTSAKRLPIVFRAEYGLYYILTFLDGCRRQIFSIFASYALILVYHVSVQSMLAIQLVNAVLIATTAPGIGKLMDRRGERGPLTLYSVALIVVFLGYATVQRRWALVALFLIDNILFSFGVGFNTYLHKIVRPGELTPCLSMGVTMNHIAAVTVPVGGAWLWIHYHSYQVPFWVGVGLAGVALVANQWLPQRAGPAAAAAS